MQQVTRPTRLLLTVALLTLGLSACGGPRYRLEPPDAFKRYEQAEGLRLITTDGVEVSAREVPHYPKADLPFWTDALKRHLLQRGYAFQEQGCFRTAKGLDGCTLDFLLPRGAQDWVLSETLFVLGERLVLVEAAGPFARFAKVAPALKQSLRTFEVVQ
jgi:hypothetical protein